MARILLGVSGGIAAYRAIELARLLTRASHGVRVLMTPTAERFVGRPSFDGIVGGPVLIDEFERDPLGGRFPGEEPADHDPISHLELAARADAYLVAPASANTIAKLAAGICDSMLTTSFVACRAPRAVAPAMNDRMLRDPAIEANLATLAAFSSRRVARASRSTPCGSSATAPAGGWGSRSRSAPPPAAPMSCWWPPTSIFRAQERSAGST